VRESARSGKDDNRHETESIKAEKKERSEESGERRKGSESMSRGSRRGREGNNQKKATSSFKHLVGYVETGEINRLLRKLKKRS